MIKNIAAASAVLVSLTVGALLSGTAVAADLPSHAGEPQFDAPPPIPVFSWTGVYLGAQVGYQIGHESAALRVPTLASILYSNNPNGIIGGAHLGFNYATPAVFGKSAIVVGLEGDVDGADSYHSTTFGGFIAGDSTSTASEVKGSIRGRLGVAVDRVLFYATGGAAFASFSTYYNATPTFGAGAVDMRTRTRTGYTVGGGVEYAFMNNFSARAEYRYTNYGTFTDALASAAPGLGATVSHGETDHRVQAGISYKFDTITPSTLVPHF
jgi:outer membrane immunogenic protein